MRTPDEYMRERCSVGIDGPEYGQSFAMIQISSCGMSAVKCSARGAQCAVPFGAARSADAGAASASGLQLPHCSR